MQEQLAGSRREVGRLEGMQNGFAMEKRDMAQTIRQVKQKTTQVIKAVVPSSLGLVQ